MKSLRALINEIDQFLDFAQRNKLSTIVCRWLLVLLVPVTFCTIAVVVFWSNIDKKSLLFKVSPLFLVFDDGHDTWYANVIIYGKLALEIGSHSVLLFLTGTIYVYFVNSLSLAFELLCNKVEHWLSSMKSVRKVDIGDIFEMRKTLQSLFEQFNQLMDIVPVTWCSIMFAITTGYIVFNIQHKKSQRMLEYVSEFLFLLSFSGYFGIVIYHVSNVIDQMALRRDRLLTTLNEANCGNYVNQEQLNQIKVTINSLQLKLTGCKLFNVNRSMLLNMAGSLLTFCVLFVQLTGVSLSQ